MDRTDGRSDHTFLIVDIRGYTAFTAEHGDAAATQLAARFADIVGEAAEAWNGRLLELRGDEALCVFDDPRSAVRAAIELQDAFADEVADDASLPLRTGIGLAAGEAVPLGTGYRGSALNLAARLCSVSSAGEVHASRELIADTGPIEGLRFDRVGGLDLKGFPDTHWAYRVEPIVPYAAHPPSASEADDASSLETDALDDLPGRAREMRWLRWHWRRARHGHGRVIVVGGPAGVGKSRLAAELAAVARRDGARVVSATEAPDAADDRPTLVISDGDGGDPAQGEASALGASTTLWLTIEGADARESMSNASATRIPRLEVRPLDLEGVRALGVRLAPDTADELPVARILESSGGRPGPAREAILDWSERVLAERATGTTAGSLPADRSPFVGRVDELETARGLLGDTRLLTLTGPPGTGKTRLALQLARAAAQHYPDGVCFVPLAAVRDEALLTSAIARALQLRIGPDATALDVVSAYLAERRSLLVLDNFEQLHGAAADLGRLLAAAAQLTVLVTSRSSLELAGEQVYLVPPLRLAQPGAASLGEVAGADAPALFVLRARSVDPTFDLRSDNAAVVAAIAARLEGLPLAIELAAARIRTLGAHELLEHLERRLPLLTGGRADAVAHHQTMREAIDWSYELLDPEERHLLRHLSVFRGSFELTAAARVADLSDEDALDRIDALVTQSLVQRTDDRPHARFGLLELIREFAGDQLEAHGETKAARSRHTAVEVALVVELEPRFESSDPGEAIERLALEIDDLRAALEHAIATREAESSLLLAACAWRFWHGIGQLAEGRQWVERALDLPGGPVPARARATAALGGLCYWLGDFAGARESYLRARDLYTAVGDGSAEANAIYSLSLVATYEGDLDMAERYADEAMELARGSGDETMIAEVLAAQFLIAWQRGELARARGLGEATLEIAERLGLSAMIATQLVGLAGVAHMEGDTDEALRRAGEALDLTVRTENTHTQIFALDAIASFAAHRSPLRAVRLCSAAAALRSEHGGGWTLAVMGVECGDVAAGSVLDSDELEAARTSGAELDLVAATEVARAILAESMQGEG